jgi:rsbT co-antagonist protein RsbR
VQSGTEGRAISWNRRALDLLGLTADELQGRTPIDPRWNVLRDDGRPLSHAELPGPLAIARKSPVLDVVLGVFAPSGVRRRWLQCSAVPKLGPDGEVEHVVCTLTDVTELKEAEEYARARAEALARSSIPLIPIAEHVIVMPLIGVLDAQRGPRMLETLLQGIAAHSARVAILDVTGVSVVDAEAADALLRAVRAARLLGAEVILSGIRPSVAQGILALHEITACGTLQAAIAFARRSRG